MEENLQEKLNNLTRAILDESHSVTEKILEEVNRKREAAKAAGEAAVKSEVSHYKKAKITEMKSRESRRITACTVENHRELIKLRDEYSSKVFELLREKIAAFTETAQYLDKLKQYLNRGLNTIGGCGRIVVLLRKADMKYAEELASATEGYDIEFQCGNFEIGGLLISCRSKNMSVDMTYDTELRDLGGHFAEMFGLELE